MDALSLLKQDHQRVTQLFDQIETSRNDPAQCRQLFDQLKQELDVHTHIEETIFYPQLKQIAQNRDTDASEAREQTDEAYDEHQEVKDLLTAIARLSPTDNEWHTQLKQLRASVEHHVEEEEGEMFDTARDVFSQVELDQLGTTLNSEKQRQISVAKAM